ncbi:four helix bundle protein [Geminocystis sp. CENA526]
MAQGSVNELQTFLILATRVHLCTEKEVELILENLKEETRMISSLINKLS